MSIKEISQALEALLADANQKIATTTDLNELNDLRVSFLGKKGRLTEILKGVGKLPVEEKPQVGKLANQIKTELQSTLTDQETKCQQAELARQLADEKVDVTLPGRKQSAGSLHPVTRVTARVTQIFSSMGFEAATGPEIEDEYHNFNALNIPENHPARAMADTFYLEGDRLLRTHTSPVQIREMKKKGAPIRLIALGRVYRCDSDQTHTPMFHQVEGLVIEKKCHFTHLKGLLQDFLNQFFETDLTLRFRPSYFPFTEPSAEVDIYKPATDDWLEVLGCGMVHPNVLRNVGIDPDEYSGFAFGCGLDRLAMLRYNIPDLRLLFENDLRFLKQF